MTSTEPARNDKGPRRSGTTVAIAVLSAAALATGVGSVALATGFPYNPGGPTVCAQGGGHGGCVQPPVSEPVSNPGSTPESNPGSNPGSNPESRPGSSPGSTPGSTPESPAVLP